MVKEQVKLYLERKRSEVYLRLQRICWLLTRASWCRSWEVGSSWWSRWLALCSSLGLLDWISAFWLSWTSSGHCIYWGSEAAHGSSCFIVSLLSLLLKYFFFFFWLKKNQPDKGFWKSCTINNPAESICFYLIDIETGCRDVSFF